MTDSILRGFSDMNKEAEENKFSFDVVNGILNSKDLKLLQTGNWLIVQRQDFEVYHDRDEPYQAMHVYLKCHTGQYSCRVWDKSVEFGFIQNAIEFESLILRFFGQTMPCVGHLKSSVEFNLNPRTFVKIDFPFERTISKNCELFYITKDDSLGQGMCSKCKDVTPAKIIRTRRQNNRKQKDDEDANDLFKIEVDEECVLDVTLKEEEQEKYDEEYVMDDDADDIKEKMKIEKKMRPSRKRDDGLPGRQCNHCDKKTGSDRGMFHHVTRYHLYGPFACKFCETFKCLYAQELFIHVQTSHGEEKFSCPSCSDSELICLENVDQFEKHYLECVRTKQRDEKSLKVKEIKNSKRHQCKICFKTYPMEKLIREHMDWHNGLKPLKCTECNFATCYSSSLWSHNLRHLREKGAVMTETNLSLVFNCEQCDKTFGRKGLLKQHVNIVHEGIRDLRTCEFCGMTFTNKSQWRRHKLREHSKKARFPCPVCQAGCIDKHELNTHMRVHNDPEFICKYCGKAVKSRQSLMAHERAHTGENPFKCDLCDYACKASSVLCKHKVLKHKVQFNGAAKGLSKNIWKLREEQEQISASASENLQ